MACQDPEDTGESATPPVEDSEDTSPPGDSDSDEPGDSDSGDPGNPTDVLITELDWTLHEDMQSLVYVTWEQSAAATVHVEFAFEGSEWMSSPSFQASAGAHEQILLGIPFGEVAGWYVVVEGGSSFEGELIETGPLPVGLPIPTVEVAETDGWLAEGKYLLASINQESVGWGGGTYWTYIIDRQARPVWASAAPNRNWTLFAQVAVTGDHILWDEATAWSNYDDGAGSKVHRTYLDGEIDVIDTRGLHHAFVQLPDETLVWGSQDHGGGEALVEMAPDAEKETILWTCSDDWYNTSYCESNGIFYSVERDAFLYSFYTNDTLVEVDHATGESLWWAGELNGGYSFDPPDSKFSWQHGVSYTDEGNLLVSTYARNDGNTTTMVREYVVNHKERVLEEVWNYDPGCYASTNGDAWRLDNGNTLHLVGSASEIFEVTEKGEVVWHLDYHSSQLLGRGEFIENLYDFVSSQGY